MSRILTVIVAVVAFAVIFVAEAHASDVKLLKQPSAFPLVIGAPGSYRLKSNITVPDANTTAISITADDVTLDLNGYAIIGPVVCTGVPVTSCAPSGTANGIDSAKVDITVMNGTVRGMGRSGISLGIRARVKEVRAVSNGFRGIETGSEATITSSTAASNGDSGITAGDSATITGNVAEGNAFDGISASGAVMSSNTAQRNGGNGINADSSTTIIGNSASLNGGFGIQGGGYAHNVSNINAFGAVNAAIDMGNNVCNFSTTCP
jgi:hypothetical protein